MSENELEEMRNFEHPDSKASRDKFTFEYMSKKMCRHKNLGLEKPKDCVEGSWWPRAHFWETNFRHPPTTQKNP